MDKAERTAMDVVERVARAIADHIHKGGDFGLDGETAYKSRSAEFDGMSRAAILAYEAAKPAPMSTSGEMVERLREACVGHPHAKIAWPHRLLHDAASRLESLEALFAEQAGELAKRDEWVLHWQTKCQATNSLLQEAKARALAAEAALSDIRKARGKE